MIALYIIACGVAFAGIVASGIDLAIARYRGRIGAAWLNAVLLVLNSIAFFYNAANVLQNACEHSIRIEVSRAEPEMSP